MNNKIAVITDKKQLIETAVSGIGGSEHTRRAYARDLTVFLEWLEDNGKELSRESFAEYKDHLVGGKLAPATVNRALTAVKSTVGTLGEFYGLDPAAVLAVKSVKGVSKSGRRQNRWLTAKEIYKLKESVNTSTLRGKQEAVALGLLLGCALRREEIANLKWSDIKRQGDVVYLELSGKGNKTRQIPVPVWTQEALAEWEAVVSPFRDFDQMGYAHVLQSIDRHGNLGSGGITPQAVYDLAKRLSKQARLGEIAPHNYRRTWAAHAYRNTGNIKQIGLILGHSNIETTEIYLGIASVDLEKPLLLEF